jgi:hypothetical protein
MTLFQRCFVCAFALSAVACAEAVDLPETFELREPEVRIYLELHTDGTAVFDREIKEAAGAISKFHSKRGTWSECKGAKDRPTSGRSSLKETTCFVVEVNGADEQGETQFGMMFVRNGDSLMQQMESGPTFMLKPRNHRNREQ